MRNYHKKSKVILILVILIIVISILGIFGYIYYNNKSKEKKVKDKINEINSHYNQMVITSKRSAIYKYRSAVYKYMRVTGEKPRVSAPEHGSERGDTLGKWFVMVQNYVARLATHEGGANAPSPCPTRLSARTLLRRQSPDRSGWRGL